MSRLPRLGLLAAALALALPAPAAEIDAVLLAKAGASGRVPTLLVFPDQTTPSLAPLRTDADVLERRRSLVEALRARASREQTGVREWLDARGIAHRDYWVANVISARLTAVEMSELAARDDLVRVASNLPVRPPLPVARSHQSRAKSVLARPWGIDKIAAPQAWAAGIKGQGIVVAGADTGYEWTHPALQPRYRGWDGSQAVHDYNWHDAVHQAGSSCGANAPAPCDDHGHGTHTMGTMVGTRPDSDIIGVAPRARWIGCRNMNAGDGTPARYIECMQWFLAPTDGAGNNPDPAMAPDVINNSWGCIPSEGCTTGEELRSAVDNVVAGGILFVAAAGNSGPACNTIKDAPATYAGAFVVAASDSADALANFSSRGPVPGAESVSLDIAAPGVGVLSSTSGGNYGYSQGTSMASPHAAGVAALVMSADPSLRGQPEAVAQILRASARRDGISDPYRTGCGGLGMMDWPNWQAGYGRLDAWQAVLLARPVIFVDDFEP